MTLGKNFRLPVDVRPSRYAADLSIDLVNDRFEGQLTIDLALERSRGELNLHAVDLDVTSAFFEAGGQKLAVRQTTVDAESETVTLTFDGPLPAGAGALKLSWKGKFTPGLRGLYRAGPIAVTQFEAADARRVFPCFDEPAFKARWELALSNLPTGVVAISNGSPSSDTTDAGGSRRVVFSPTPPLSSYLVAVIVGDLVSSAPAGSSPGAVATRTWTVPSKKHLTAFAQDCATAVLPKLEAYFGLPYPFGKLDQIGVPDFEAGAMENAGAVTFREVALLLEVATAPLAVQKRVAEVITHELAHQWFGNLVTMVWWDDLWLNEAFATWMAYKIVDQWRPDWQIWMDFEVGKGSALMLDSLQSAHPIRADVNNAEEAGESFDAITYEKGGAVLRMIEGFLGEARFRDGIRLYMRRHREANATADDLWGALAEASGQPIVELANGWIRQVGYPLVTLGTADTGAATRTVTIRQTRFFADPRARGKGDTTRWLVPMVLRFRDARGIREQAVLLKDGEQQVTLDAEGDVAWCLGNAGGRGFYRTAYDESLLRRLLRPQALADLEPTERMGLVSDQWALVRAEAAPVEGFLDLVASLRDESNHVVLDEIVNRLSIIEHRHLAEADRERFQQFVTSLFAQPASRLGWQPPAGSTEDDETRLRRAALLRAIVLLGRDPAATAEAVRRFPTPKASAPLDPNLLDVVVTAVARGADRARFDDLRERSRAEADPAAKRRYLHALGRVETAAVAEAAVGLALGDEIPMQDFTSYLNVLLGNRATREQALSLVVDRFDAVRAKASSPMLLRRLVEALGVLPERRQLAIVKKFLADHPIDGAKQATAQTLERLEMDVALRERLIPEISAWLARWKPSP